jgi:hypothetical protein
MRKIIVALGMIGIVNILLGGEQSCYAQSFPTRRECLEDLERNNTLYARIEEGRIDATCPDQKTVDGIQFWHPSKITNTEYYCDSKDGKSYTKFPLRTAVSHFSVVSKSWSPRADNKFSRGCLSVPVAMQFFEVTRSYCAPVLTNDPNTTFYRGVLYTRSTANWNSKPIVDLVWKDAESASLLVRSPLNKEYTFRIGLKDINGLPSDQCIRYTSQRKEILSADPASALEQWRTTKPPATAQPDPTQSPSAK